MTSAVSGAGPGELQPTRGALRTVRGLVLTATCTTVACAGHVAGGGSAPSAPALIVVAALVGAGFVVLADRRRGFGQILLAALGTQPLFHLAFSLTGHGASDGSRPGTLHPMTETQLSAAGAIPAVDLPMAAGHVAAATVVSWLVADGEALVWALCGLFARLRVPLLVPVRAGRPLPGPNTRGLDVALPRRHLLARLPARRGPPA